MQTSVIIGNAFERERKLARQKPQHIMWTRQELTDLLNIYGREVAAGQWRDYAIDDGREQASFSIFRRSSEIPLYRINKTPDLHRRQVQRQRQRQYGLHDANGQVLRRGRELKVLLRFFDRKNIRLID